MSVPTAPTPKKTPAWKAGGVTVVAFVALLYVIEAVDQVMLRGGLDQDGIRPWEGDGLWGVLWAPLLHQGWPHLVANTLPALIFGFLASLSGYARFLTATALIWVLGGLGTWVTGNLGSATETVHIGASGLIMGWLTYVIVLGFFTRTLWQIAVGVIVFFVYGSVLLGVLPGVPGVSWQAHLCGALAGVFAAYALSGRERRARQSNRSGQPSGLPS